MHGGVGVLDRIHIIAGVLGVITTERHLLFLYYHYQLKTLHPLRLAPPSAGTYQSLRGGKQVTEYKVGP